MKLSNSGKSDYIFYDSKCNFCNAVIRFVEKHDKQKKFEKISLYSSEARELLKKKGIQFIDLQTIYVVDQEGVFKRSKAIFKILGSLSFPINLLAGFQILPYKLTDYFYNIIAKNRYKWFGKTGN